MNAVTSGARNEAPAVEPVFVFGSDLSGSHEQETATWAVRMHAAGIGKGSGPTGNAYAIPYRNSARDLLPINVIRNYVDAFLRHAGSEPGITFHIARFGTEAGAHDDLSVAGLFRKTPANCQLPGVWSRALDPRRPARLLLFDPGAHFKEPAWQERLARYLALNLPLWNVPSVELVSVGLARQIVANDLAARKLGLRHRIIGVNEGWYGRNAQGAAEYRAVWYSTHVLSVADFEQTAQPQHIRVIGAAARAGLTVEQIDSSSMG